MAQPSSNPKIDELRVRIKADPKSRLFYPLAEELRKIAQYAEAEQVLRTGLSTHATYLSAWVSLGRVLRDISKNEEAVEALSKALMLDPGNVVAARLLADAYLALGQRVEAIKKYKLVHALLPSDQDLEATIEKLESEISSPADASAPAFPPEDHPTLQEMVPLSAEADLVSPIPKLDSQWGQAANPSEGGLLNSELQRHTETEPRLQEPDPFSTGGEAGVISTEADPFSEVLPHSQERDQGSAESFSFQNQPAEKTLATAAESGHASSAMSDSPFSATASHWETSEETVHEREAMPTLATAIPSLSSEAEEDSGPSWDAGDTEPMLAAHDESPFEEPSAGFGYSSEAYGIEHPGGMHEERAPGDFDAGSSFDENSTAQGGDAETSHDGGLFAGRGLRDGEPEPYVERGIASDLPFALESTLAPPDADDFAKTITMADLYAGQGLVDEARDIYEDVLARDPNNAIVRAKMAALDESPVAPLEEVEQESPQPQGLSEEPAVPAGELSGHQARIAHLQRWLVKMGKSEVRDV